MKVIIRRLLGAFVWFVERHGSTLGGGFCATRDDAENDAAIFIRDSTP